jgi:hypothetical protein
VRLRSAIGPGGAPGRLELREGERDRVELFGGEGQKALERVEEAIELGLAAIVGAPADDRLARVEQHVEDADRLALDSTGQGSHVVERGVRRAEPDHPGEAERSEHTLREIRAGRLRVRVLDPRGHPAAERRGDRDLQHAARAGHAGVVIGQVVGAQRRADEVGATLVRLVEEGSHARLDAVPETLEGRHVGGREAEPARTVGDRRASHRRLDRLGEPLELSLELIDGQAGGVAVPMHVGGGTGRRLPGVMMRPDLAIAPALESGDDLGGRGRRDHRIGDQIGGSRAVLHEALVEPGQRDDVLERRVLSTPHVPLVVALGVDADHEVELAHRS